MTDDVELTAVDDEYEVRVVVSPTSGGRIRQIFVSGVGLLAESIDDDPRSTGWGSFPMAPWAGRIRNGRFDFLGESIVLDLNHQDRTGVGGGVLSPPVSGTLDDDDDGIEHRDRHAIHGTTFTRPWRLDADVTPSHLSGADASRIEMSCDLVGSLSWPFAGVARQTITVEPHRIELAMSVESTDGAVFPASLGWHPWFAKPDRLDFDPVAMYEQDAAGLPTGRLVEPPSGPWDDCFVNHVPVRLHYDRAVASTVTVSSPADHWVLFDRLGHATCVEPQTGPPDAPTVRPKVVAPGAPLHMTMTIAWT